jgi:(p)ppGpp synthase/HD superfamily hydrolase
MNTEPYVETARLIAHRAHDGQVDKAGRPYIEHPARVAAEVAALGPRHEAAAWLHDVVEDTYWSIAHIRAWAADQGTPMPWEVMLAVEALTKRREETYLDAVRRASVNPLARSVKLADNLDNSAEERLALLDQGTADRLRKKYQRARAILTPTRGD